MGGVTDCRELAEMPFATVPTSSPSAQHHHLALSSRSTGDSCSSCASISVDKANVYFILKQIYSKFEACKLAIFISKSLALYCTLRVPILPASGFRHGSLHAPGIIAIRIVPFSSSPIPARVPDDLPRAKSTDRLRCRSTPSLKRRRNTLLVGAYDED